ncbi:hypothetical protein K2X33_00610 [bacterium]|nr:hypothetical protein [bacterium]
MKSWTFAKRASMLALSATALVLSACGAPTGVAAPLPGLPPGTVIPNTGLCGGIPANGSVGTAAYTADLKDQYGQTGSISLSLYTSSGTTSPFVNGTAQSIVAQGRIATPNRSTSTMTGLGYCLSTTDFASGVSSPGQMLNPNNGGMYMPNQPMSQRLYVRLIATAIIQVLTYKNGATYSPYASPYMGGVGSPYQPGTNNNGVNLAVGRLEARVGTKGTCDTTIDTSYKFSGCIELVIPNLDGDLTLQTTTI